MKRLTGFIVIILLLLLSNFTFGSTEEIDQVSSSLSERNEGNFLTVNDNEFISTIVGKDYKIVGFTNILKKKSNKGGIADNQIGESVYIVQAGDSLYLIAVRNNSTVQEIKDLNNLKSDMLMVGQHLLLPGQADESDDETPGDGDLSPDPGTNDNIYIVKAGDSLYLVAIRNDTTVQEIKDLNNLESDMLMVGQHLLLPGQADGSNDERPGNGDDSGNGEETPEQPGTGESNAPIVYFVKPGDSLWLISNKFNTTSDNIIELNHLPSNSLYVGQLLYITFPDIVSNKFIYHVQSSDSLSSIATQFSTSVNQIIATNNLTSDELVIGQKLLIIIPDYSNRNYNIILDYYVEVGDNVKTISSKFNISPWELKDFNEIRYDFLDVGHQVQVPFLITDNMNQSITITAEEMELLTKAVYSEARGEPFEGQVAVAAVILNRVKNSVFPDTIEGVIFQPWQFTAISDGQFWLEPDQTAYLAAQAALEGWDPSFGALYYYNPETATSEWVFYRDVIIKIGEHYFALAV